MTEDKILYVTDSPGGNYVDKLLKEAGKNPKKGVQHVNVYHDDWCDIYKGKPCNCNPEIKVTP